ncbi:MAG: hypothetical protein VB948_16545 [Pseudomonadales bacterium]
MRTMNHAILFALLISSSGCMTMQPLADEPVLTEAIEVGDKVEIIEKDGYINEFTVGRITDQFIAGNDDIGSLVTIPLEKIQIVSVEKVSVGRTTLAVLGGIVAIPIFLVGAGAMVMACGSGSC